MQEKLRILCVDDEQDILNLLQSILKIMGFDVMQASSGDEALKIVKTGAPFFMVITDHQMPGMSGYELLRQIKTISPDTVRVICSGGLCTEEADESKRRGDCEHFIAKPWDNSQLIDIMYNEAMRYKISSGTVLN